VRVEAYILPLVRTDAYLALRRLTEGGTIRVRPGQSPPDTLMELRLHVAGAGAPLSDWTAIRLGDTALLRKRVESQIRRDLGDDDAKTREAENERLFWQLPITIGVGVTDGRRFADQMREFWHNFNLGSGEPVESAYRGVPLTRVGVNPEGFRQILGFLRYVEDQFPLVAYVPTREVPRHMHRALIGDGYWFGAQEEGLRRQVDVVKGRPKAGEGEEANASLFLAPSQPKARAGIELYLEWQTHRLALANGPAWEVLHRAGQLSEGATEAERQAAALRWFGHVPASPDGVRYAYDVRTGEVTNLRHGTLREPRLRAALADEASLRRLLDQFRTLRVDLRFREDGVHTILTLDRSPK
jgi:hypothetical protein